MKIRRSFSQHDGGTKAYQVIEIQSGGKAVVVCQYGKFRAGDSVEGWSAQVDLKGPFSTAASFIEASNKINEKRRRGYKSWDSSELDFASRDKLEDALRRLIGPFKTASAMMMLAGAAVANDEPTGDPENDDKGKAKAPVIRTEESMPEWATW